MFFGALSSRWVLVLAGFLLWLPILLAQPDLDGVLLRPHEVVEREFTVGEVHTYLVELQPGNWRLAVEQRGVDLVVTVVGPAGEGLVVDSPLDREGTESLILQPTVAGSYRIELRAQERAAPAGRYEIRLNSLSDGDPQQRARLMAEIAMMEAAQFYAQSSAAGRRGALVKYSAALSHWRTAGDEGGQARALYGVAVLQRLVGENEQALESAREVLSLWRRLEDRYWEAATLNEIGLNLWSLGEIAAARVQYEETRRLRQAIGDRLGAASAANNVCSASLVEGELRQALACYQPLLEILQELEVGRLAATVETNVGLIYDRLGEPDLALHHYRQALALAAVAGDHKGEAKALNNLARVWRGLGEFEPALRHYEQALKIFQEVGDRQWQGVVLNNIAFAYNVLGEPRRALTFFNQVLKLSQTTGHRPGEVDALNNLGLVYRHLGEPNNALSFHHQALALAAEVDISQAVTLKMLGWTHLALGNSQQALTSARQALALLQETDDRPQQAETLHLLGRAQRLAGRPREATERLEQALLLVQQMRDPASQAEILTALAQTERDGGRLEAARKHIEAAIRSIEALRGKVAASGLRDTFLSSRRETYEFHIDLLMELHRSAPQAGYDREALAASEYARSRTLLDLLNEAGADIHQGANAVQLEQRGALERRLLAKARRQRLLLARDHSTEEAEAAELELASVLNDLDRVEAEIRLSSPRYAELTQPRPLDAESIQALVEEGTTLLEYSLGDERSVLWRVTAREITSFELPARREIEALARNLHGELSVPGPQDRRGQSATAARLSDLLLGPVADLLGEQRIVVVADGALHYVPFGALPSPGTAEPVLVRHEVVYLPSASVLATQRHHFAGRSPAPGRLAILADPVFEEGDPRLFGSPRTPSSTACPEMEVACESLLRQPGLNSFKRLPGSRREAEVIVALVEPGQALEALGFAASRATVFGQELGRHRIVHFATHGLVDTQTPRLSGLVLSRFDKEGQPQEGFLSLHDVYNLKLQADLVVLSGCQTALGREVRGAGLVGLTRGFMYAGSPRVAASLWRVEDRATAELMTRFYRAMWIDGAPPAAALRQAQLAMRRERKWKDPYFWAAFVLQGEWRPTPGAP